MQCPAFHNGCRVFFSAGAYNVRMPIYTVMTFNLKSGSPLDTGDLRWSRRSKAVLAAIRQADPDLIGVQELTAAMLPQFSALSEVYEIYGKSRHSLIADERSCILFKKDRFHLQKEATFWLSDQPEHAGSQLAWSIYPRIVSAAVLEDVRSHVRFTFANTHLDHMFPFVRSRQADILGACLHGFQEGRFLILTGDFNTTLKSRALHEITAVYSPLHLKSAYRQDPGNTMRIPLHDPFHLGQPIDQILVSPQLHVIRTEVLHGRYEGLYPSDHYPVLCRLEYPQQILDAADAGTTVHQ